MADSSYYGSGGGGGGRSGGKDGNEYYKANNNIFGGGKSSSYTNNKAGGGGNNKNYNANNNNSNINLDANGVIKASKAADHSKIFVGGLSWQTTEESLRWHFEQYGQVTSVEVMRDRNTGDPRGFAFVVFVDPSTLDLVMADADKHEINHKFVDVKRAQARGIAPPSIHGEREAAAAAIAGITDTAPSNSDDLLTGPYTGGAVGQNNNNVELDGIYGPSRNNKATNNNIEKSSAGTELTPEQLMTKVFVGGIPPSVDRDELKEIFSAYGPVVDSIVMVDQVTQRSRCFGFITYATGSGGAQKAVLAQPITVQGRNVEVKLATPRSEQQQQQQGTGTGTGRGTNAPHHQSMTNTSNNNNSMNNNNMMHGTNANKRTGAPGHLGLRSGKQSLTNNGEFAGLAVAYGRNGWKAGYGTKAFGKAGWSVEVSIILFLLLLLVSFLFRIFFRFTKTYHCFFFG